jgi:hypothetical protein
MPRPEGSQAERTRISEMPSAKAIRIGAAVGTDAHKETRPFEKAGFQ